MRNLLPRLRGRVDAAEDASKEAVDLDAGDRAVVLCELAQRFVGSDTVCLLPWPQRRLGQSLDNFREM